MSMVKLFDGSIVKFPDDMGNEEIAKVILEHAGEQKRDPGTIPWNEVLGTAILNIPKSAKENVLGAADAIAHPVKTYDAVSKIATGAYQKLKKGEQGNEKYFDATVKFLIDRYGSVEGYKRTIAEDPVGVAVDLAGALIPAGKISGATGKATGMNKVVRAGKALEKIGAAVEPITQTANIAKKVAQKIIPERTASKLYESAAKLSTALPKAAREKIVKTALDNKIMPNVKGIEKISDQIDLLNSRITAMIDSATETGKKIPVDKLFTEFRDLQRKASLSGTPESSKRAINKVRKEIYNANIAAGRKALTPSEAQQLKQTIYKDLQSYYSSVTEAPASIRAQKSVAKAAKVAIEEILPEIKNLNATEGSLIALRKEIEKSAARISNRDILGIGVPLKGALGSTFGPSGVASGVALGLLDTPAIKAKLAIVVNTLKNKKIKISPDSAAVTAGLIQLGRTSEE